MNIGKLICAILYTFCSICWIASYIIDKKYNRTDKYFWDGALSISWLCVALYFYLRAFGVL